MSNLAEQLKHGAGQAWESLTEGWRELGARASGALTRFWNDADDAQPANAAEDKPTPANRTTGGLPPARWAFMAVDVYGAADKLVVRIEAPGMAQEDFQIEMRSPELLSVLGRKRYDRMHAGSSYALVQCAYGTFRRDIRLPVPVDGERSKASYEAGVLRIELPRRELSSHRRIEVRAT
ncbi:Hsp20/alpha crystallin family protein [Roseateles asaccharophilus]|uniref:HSP20 family protein n=1 Tax=Roseateles asaccharophilus TaxID=582607 RepID=A0ABU2AC30_9BURK|nr:Hsp20/alpha crystallin family protein [Roseateles asaccharophilus]MDR7334565.1 HSP20 family protein [Roseateles asaccharophilus]